MAPPADPDQPAAGAVDVGVAGVAAPPGPGSRAGQDAGSGSDLRSVLGVVPFRRLWIALSLSSLGDWLGLLATTALASELASGFAAQNYAVGGVLFVRLLPALVLGPLAGAVADRFNRRWTMVIADVLRSGLFVSIPIVRSLPWLIVSSFLIECLSLLWIPSKEASVPNLLRKDQLERANQLNLLSTYGSAPVAALVFFLLSSLNSVLAAGLPFFRSNPVDLALYFDGASFLFSAATVAGLREITRARASGGPGRDAPRPSFFRSITDGWRFVGTTPLVRGLIVGLLGAASAAGTVIGLGRTFVSKPPLNGGNAAYGILFGAIFLGLASGMFLGPKLLGQFNRRRLPGIAITAAGLCLGAVAVLPNFVLALGFTVLVGAFGGVAWVVGYTLLGREVDDEVRGRTFAFLQSVVQIDLLLTLAAAPLLAGAIGVHVARLGPLHLRVDGVTVVLFLSGLLAAVLGVAAYRQMDDGSGPTLATELRQAVRSLPHVHTRRNHQGLFIALEGGEGAGKSTQSRLLAGWLRETGFAPVMTREPGATPAGRRLRELLLDPDTRLSDRAEALLYAADRADHVATVVRPALDAGGVVVTDRYVDSSLAYQAAGRTLPAQDVARISTWATGGLKPDLVVLLDLPPEVGLARSLQPADRMEQESLEFHGRVHRAFLDRAARDPRRYLVVDAALPPAQVHEQVRRRVAELLRTLGMVAPAGGTGAGAGPVPPGGGGAGSEPVPPGSVPAPAPPPDTAVDVQGGGSVRLPADGARSGRR